MPKFAANLTMLYNELGFLERFDAAAGLLRKAEIWGTVGPCRRLNP